MNKTESSTTRMDPDRYKTPDTADLGVAPLPSGPERSESEGTTRENNGVVSPVMQRPRVVDPMGPSDGAVAAASPLIGSEQQATDESPSRNEEAGVWKTLKGFAVRTGQAFSIGGNEKVDSGVALAAKRADEAALSVLKKVVLNEPDVKQEVRAWSARIRDSQRRGEPTTVLVHTALTYIVRSGFLDAPSKEGPSHTETARFNAEIRTEVMESVRTGWKDLTGKVPSDDRLLERLPRGVLRGASREARTFHAASFQGKYAPAEAHREVAFGKDYVPEFKDGLAAAGVLAAAFTATGGPLIAGAITGYAIVTLAESYLHDKLGHASMGLVQKIKSSAPWLGSAILGKKVEDARFGHLVVHHGRTYRGKYTEQFASEEEKAKLDAELEKLGDLGKNIMEEQYGVTLNAKGVLSFIAPVAPVFGALLAGSLAMGLPMAFIAGALIPAVLYPSASKYMHPYLHMPREEAMKKAGPLMRILLKTRYAEMISRHHYGHHRGRGGNYNLIPGGDVVLKQLRKPTLKQMFEMRDLDMIR